MFCNQCGEENRNDRKFCSNCGAKLRDYTKPRENLIMPEDVEKYEEKSKNYDKLLNIFKILMIISFLSAIILLAVSFFVEGRVQMAVIIICIVMFALFFVFLILKKVITSKKFKHINEDI